MQSKIQNLRFQAFPRQQGRCWYCGVQMWHKDPAELPDIPSKGAAACVAPLSTCRQSVTAAGMKPATWLQLACSATTPGTNARTHHLPSLPR